MKKFNKFNIAILSCVLMLGCNTLSEKTAPDFSNNNYMVLLDLSDRVLLEGQVERDIEVITAVFNQFKKSVESNIYIRSNDEFKVLIAPQKNMSFDPVFYEDNLRINLHSLKITQKREAVSAFEDKLNDTLHDLYQEATKNTNASRYHGADIWAFCNADLSDELRKDENSNNYLFVITDGYIYLENQKSYQKKNRYYTFEFIDHLRRDDFATIIDSLDYGLIPTEKTFSNLSVMLCELSPKYVDTHTASGVKFRFEFDLLQALWGKFFDEMHIANIAFIRNSTKAKEGKISEFLSVTSTP